MMGSVIRRLRRDEGGATVIEMAFAFPALIMMIWMIAQLGLVFRAMAGMQHGLGEGARYATIYPKPTTTQIETKINDAVYGIGPGNFAVSPPAAGTADGASYLDLQVTYSQQTNLLLLPGPTVNVTRKKRVWIAT
jgi:Flp pilus assembly protein TadG